MIKWNKDAKLIVSDFDETITKVYQKTHPELIKKIEKILQEDIVLFIITGAGLQSIKERFSDLISPKLRKYVLIANCHGAQIWGFESRGELMKKPFFDIYEKKLSLEQKKLWRVLVKDLIKEFNLIVYPTMSPDIFSKKTENNPLSIMLADRGPQITFEMPNDYLDLRDRIIKRGQQLITQYKLPLYAFKSGVFAIDFIISGVNKTTAIKYFVNSSLILKSVGLTKKDLEKPEKTVEVWGDKFVDGPDILMCQALPSGVRAIDFRQEDLKELPKGYNIQLWTGEKNLQDGLLEYLELSFK